MKMSVNPNHSSSNRTTQKSQQPPVPSKQPTTHQQLDENEIDYSLVEAYMRSLGPAKRIAYWTKVDLSQTYRRSEAIRLTQERNKKIRAEEKVEQARADAVEHMHTTEQDSWQQIRDLSDEVPRLTVAFIGVKGSAATTTTMVHAASMSANITRSALIASDFNPASGTCADRFDKGDGKTVNIREFLGELDKLDSFNKVIQNIRPTRYSVRVISANDIVSTSEHLNKDDAKKMLEVIENNCEYHFVDTANDITDDVSLAVFEKSDVFVFTANVAVQDSLRRLATGMETLRRHGFKDKVNRSIVVISNLPSEHNLDDYKKYVHRVNIENEVVQEYNFEGQFLQIPHDPIISRDTVVDLEALSWKTAQAYRNLNVAIFEQAPQFWPSESEDEARDSASEQADDEGVNEMASTEEAFGAPGTAMTPEQEQRLINAAHYANPEMSVATKAANR